MKKIKLYIIGVMMLLPTFSMAATASFGVTFGNPQTTGGICIGKGVCRTSDQSNDETHVTFQTMASQPDVVTMTFVLSELAIYQPDQVDYFTGSDIYTFDAMYNFPPNICTALNLPAGARVMPGTPCSVSITSGLVTMTVPYIHD